MEKVNISEISANFYKNIWRKILEYSNLKQKLHAIENNAQRKCLESTRMTLNKNWRQQQDLNLTPPECTANAQLSHSIIIVFTVE
jgi:hypothetical protein